MIPWFVFVVPAAFAALGGAFALKGVSLRRQARVCAQWPVASGKILAAREDVQHIEDTNDKRHRDDEFFGATVSYAYQVGGSDYRSTRLYPGRPVLTGSEKAAQAVVAKYPPGASVSVFYNPANPAEAMLEPLNAANSNLALTVGIGFGAFGLLAIFLLLQVSAA